MALFAWLVALAPAVAAGQEVTLVVPFELERFDARVAWLSEGVAIGLTEALADRGVTVISRDERLAAFERLQLPAGASLTRATVIKVAELVGASRVVTGRVGGSDTEIAIAARVLDIPSARLAEPMTEVTPVAALLAAFTRAAAKIDGQGEVRPDAAAGVAPSVPAFELFVRGLVAANNEAQERYLAQALTMAGSYERRAAGALGRAHGPRGTRTRAGGARPGATRCRRSRHRRAASLVPHRAWALRGGVHAP